MPSAGPTSTTSLRTIAPGTWWASHAPGGRSFLRQAQVSPLERGNRRQPPGPAISPGAVERRGDVEAGAGERRQLEVRLGDQQLQLGAAEQHPLGAGIPQRVDDADDPAAGGVDQVAVHQLVVDGGVEELVVGRGRHDHLDAVVRHPVAEERVGHRHRGPDQCHRVGLGPQARLGDDVGEVEQRDVDRGGDLVGHLVERRGAQHQEIGAGPLHPARRRPAARRSGPTARRPRAPSARRSRPC